MFLTPTQATSEMKSGYPNTIIDSGADTSIVGTGWHVTHVTMCTANVIGFDHRLRPLQALPIVSAVTAVDTPRGVLLLQVNEAVHNDGAQSLLSKCQLIDYGIDVDECPSPPSTPAYIQLDEGRSMYLLHRRGLAMFYHRVPTLSELHDHEPYILTCDDVWDPRKFDPDPHGGHLHPDRPNDHPTTIMRLHDEPVHRPAIRSINITITVAPAATVEPITLLARALPHVTGPADLRPHFLFRSEEIVQHAHVGSHDTAREYPWGKPTRTDETTHQIPVPSPSEAQNPRDSGIRHLVRLHPRSRGIPNSTAIRMHTQSRHAGLPYAQRIRRTRSSRRLHPRNRSTRHHADRQFKDARRTGMA